TNQNLKPPLKRPPPRSQRVCAAPEPSPRAPSESGRTGGGVRPLFTRRRGGVGVKSKGKRKMSERDGDDEAVEEGVSKVRRGSGVGKGLSLGKEEGGSSKIKGKRKMSNRDGDDGVVAGGVVKKVARK
ncbi:hypothetical protein HK097_001559, partial [Rhizophlyctis rosea]